MSERRQSARSMWWANPTHRLGVGVTAMIVAAILTMTVSCRCNSETDSGDTVQTTTAATVMSTARSTTIPTAVPTASTIVSTTVTATAVPTTAPTVSTQDDGVWNLRLVNAHNGMTQAESDQLPIVWFSDDAYCDARIVDSLRAMLNDGSRYGLRVTSAYRSYRLQERLYNNKVDRVMAAEGCSYEEALEIAAAEVARPGTSEHNTGLAVDLLYDGVWELERYWEDGEAFDWLMAHCHEYGFILRFPENKQHITGVIYEPWHYRYVGVEAATEIMGRGITLEEYLQEQHRQ